MRKHERASLHAASDPSHALSPPRLRQMLQVFDARQLSLLIGGRAAIDIPTLLESIEWGEGALRAGGFTGASRLVPQLLRQLLSDETAFSAEQRAQFLRWVTGRCAIPMGGLDKKIELRLDVDGDDTRLPRVQTCFNTLYLPTYQSIEVLQQRFALALEHRDDGFHLQ